MKCTLQTGVTLAMALVFAIAVYMAWDWPARARLFPLAIAIPMLALACFQLFVDLRGSNPTASELVASEQISPPLARRRTINIFLWIVGFFAVIWLLGFHLAVPLLVFLYLKVQSREKWRLSLACTVIAWLFVWGLFDRFLNLPFPEGAVFEWWESLPSIGAQS